MTVNEGEASQVGYRLNLTITGVAKKGSKYRAKASTYAYYNGGSENIVNYSKETTY